MVTLAQLWLPILLSAVAVWFWAFLSWAVLPVHKRDFGALPDEDGFISAMRGLGLKPGTYGFPFCHSNAQRNDPAFVEKWKTGPSGLINVWRPNPSMGGNMVMSFLVYLIVSVGIAYLATASGLPRGTSFGRAMTFFGTAGVLAYTFSFLPQMIWFQAETNAKISGVIDGLVSGLLTGLMFAMLWPK